MERIAIFVDAGYLFAQGSTAIAGAKQPRASLQLDPVAVVAALKAVAIGCAPLRELLRIYWYDGAIGGDRPTSDQASLAALDDVKLRLGFINSHGQQKGVDSLIVTDLIELARLKSISDALLLSGDEDVRIGVQIAQNHGVRVHLLGIYPARGSQSQQLMQEADTTREWPRTVVSKFMTVRPAIEPVMPTPAMQPVEAGVDDRLSDIATAARHYAGRLEPTDLMAIAAYWAEGNRGVPPDIDRRLLGICRDVLGRVLEASEKRHMRAEFQKELQVRIDADEKFPKGNAT